jgi:hypothetical protein
MTFKDLMGALAVIIAVVAYALYVWKSVRGDARPHPLSWLIFGVLTTTAYLVQRDQAAGAGAWVMAVTAATCFLLCAMGVVRGERRFPWYEWAFLVAATIVFVFYLWSRNPASLDIVTNSAWREALYRQAPAISSSLAAFVSVLGFGPTITKSWSRPYSDSASTFLFNAVKFLPALIATDNISIATCVFPVALILANAGTALVIALRRRSVAADRA